jgi:rSAM/selenodomain-associated transferase 1
MPGENNTASLLILMAKKPVPGNTKTRLSPPLSDQEAAGLYDAFLHDKVEQMRCISGVACAVACYPHESRPYFSNLAPDFILTEQRGDTLAERLANVITEAFSNGFGRVMAIDGDTPHLPIDYLQSGIDRLDDSSREDIVIGPCEDGGYYAIGLKQPHSSLFNVEMSTSQVTRDTLAHAEEAGLTVHQLPQWWDIDELPDLHRLKSFLLNRRSAEGFSPTATQNFLAKLPDY